MHAPEPFPQPSPRERRALGIIIGGLVLIPALFVASAVLGRFVLHGPVDGASLSISVGEQVGSIDRRFGDLNPCSPTARADVWRCSMSNAESSGAVPYRVRVEPDSSCWTARRERQNGTLERERATGCVNLWQW